MFPCVAKSTARMFHLVASSNHIDIFENFSTLPIDFTNFAHIHKCLPNANAVNVPKIPCFKSKLRELWIFPTKIYTLGIIFIPELGNLHFSPQKKIFTKKQKSTVVSPRSVAQKETAVKLAFGGEVFVVNPSPTDVQLGVFWDSPTTWSLSFKTVETVSFLVSILQGLHPRFKPHLQVSGVPWKNNSNNPEAANQHCRGFNSALTEEGTMETFSPYWQS